MRKLTGEPRVSVTERVDVTLSVEEVTHALRCWLSHSLAGETVPSPKTFSEIAVRFNCGDEALYGVTLTYEPDRLALRQAEES